MLPASCAAAADREIGCLVLLGADPLSDFPDRDLARAGLAGRGTIIAVDTFLIGVAANWPTSCSPAAAFAEKAGTTTNLEGRVSSLSQKVTAPVPRTPDWIIADELAVRLGHDLGFGSLDELWDEIPRCRPVTPASRHRRSRASTDGVVLADRGAGHDDGRTVGHRPRRRSEGLRVPPRPSAASSTTPAWPSPSRRRWPAWPARASLHLNPWDADRLGEPDGTAVQVESTKGSLDPPDPPGRWRAPRAWPGSSCNQPGAEVNRLLDDDLVVTDVTVATIASTSARAAT